MEQQDFSRGNLDASSRRKYQRALEIIHTGLSFEQTEQINEAIMKLAVLAEAVEADSGTISDPEFEAIQGLIRQAHNLAGQGRIPEAAAMVQQASKLPSHISPSCQGT